MGGTGKWGSRKRRWGGRRSKKERAREGKGKVEGKVWNESCHACHVVASLPLLGRVCLELSPLNYFSSQRVGRIDFKNITKQKDWFKTNKRSGHQYFCFWQCFLNSTPTSGIHRLWNWLLQRDYRTKICK